MNAASRRTRLDEDARLVVRVRREPLRLVGGYCGSPLDELGHHSPGGLEGRHKRRGSQLGVSAYPAPAVFTALERQTAAGFQHANFVQQNKATPTAVDHCGKRAVDVGPMYVRMIRGIRAVPIHRWVNLIHGRI